MTAALISPCLKKKKKWLQDNKLSDTNILPMLDLNIETSEDEELLRSLLIEFQNISEKNKKISKNNQFKKLLQTIDIGSIQSQGLEVLDYDHYLFP